MITRVQSRKVRRTDGSCGELSSQEEHAQQSVVGTYDAVPFSDPETQIRLLRPRDVSSSAQSLTYDMSVHDIASAPKYDAIPYPWGSESDEKHQVKLNNDIVEVRENCRYALWQAQQSGATFVWLDSLCINQNDLHEKSMQVAMMYDIYASAERVLACIGPEDEHSKAIMAKTARIEAFAEEDVEHVQGVQSWKDWPLVEPSLPPIQGDDGAGWIARNADKFAPRGPWNTWGERKGEKACYDFLEVTRIFFERLYWHRLWVLQEIYAGQLRVQFLVGSDTLSLRTLKLILCAISGAYGHCKVFGTKQQMNLAATFSAVGRPKRLGPLPHLEYTRFAGCSDPRDRLFGTRAFSSYADSIIQLMYPIEYARDEGIEDGNGGNGAVEDGGQDKTSEGKDVGGEYIEGEDAANQKAEYENDESQDAKYEVVGDEEAENKRAHWREDGKQRLIDQIDQCEDEGYKLVNFRLPVPDYNMSAFDVLTAISPFLADWDDLECAVHALEIRLDDPQLAPFRAGHSTKADEGIYYHWSTGVHNCCVVDEIIGANRAADQRPHSMCISEVDTGDVDYPEFRKNLVPEETQQGDLILHLRRKLPLVIDEEGYEKLPQGAEDDTQSEESQQKDHDAQPKKLQGDEVIDFHKLFDEVERDNMVLNTALVIRPDWGKDGFLVLGFSIDLGRCSQKCRLRRGEKMGGWSRTLAYVSFLASVPEMIPLVVPRGPTTTRMLLDFRVPFLHGFDTYMYTPHEDQVGYFVAVDYHGRWPSTEEENKRWVAERNIYITLV